jgi:hypothetical protein
LPHLKQHFSSLSLATAVGQTSFRSPQFSCTRFTFIVPIDQDSSRKFVPSNSVSFDRLLPLLLLRHFGIRLERNRLICRFRSDFFRLDSRLTCNRMQLSLNKQRLFALQLTASTSLGQSNSRFRFHVHFFRLSVIQILSNRINGRFRLHSPNSASHANLIRSLVPPFSIFSPFLPLSHSLGLTRKQLLRNIRRSSIAESDRSRRFSSLSIRSQTYLDFSITFQNSKLFCHSIVVRSHRVAWPKSLGVTMKLTVSHSHANHSLLFVHIDSGTNRGRTDLKG